MDDDFAAKINKLKDMLSDDKMTDNLKSMMSLFSPPPETQSNSSEQNKEQNNNSNDFDLDKLALISKIKNIMDKRNQINDPRVNLLNAIKPYLNIKRQERIDNCIKILSYTMLSNILKEEKF